MHWWCSLGEARHGVPSDEASITVIDARIHPLAAKQGPDTSCHYRRQDALVAVRTVTEDPAVRTGASRNQSVARCAGRTSNMRSPRGR